MISTVTYNGDGATRIFPVAFEIKGEEYTVVYVGGVAVADRSLYDIINNSIVFNTAPVIGTNNVEIVVASTTTEIADLNAPPSTIQTVLDNMVDINAIANMVIPNIDEILLADANATIATTKASEASISAGEALASKNSALTSASNALTSETNADTSEANALSYKNSAETSATTATTQAGIATTKAGEASTSSSQALGYRNEAEGFRDDALASATSIDPINLVHKTGDETIAGIKTFSLSPIVPAPTTDMQSATKKYVDDNKSIVVPVRQTVLKGNVDTSGFSAFGGSTGSTTVTTSSTLVATCADGLDDRVGTIVNPSWTGLSTNGTRYLYLDIATDGTCTTGSTTLAPTYRWGGADVVTNLQNTFNIQEMKMKVGNGSTASQVYRVFVGEVTVASSVVSAIVWYALMGRYDSGLFPTAVSTTYSKNHNIGIQAVKMLIRWADDINGTNERWAQPLGVYSGFLGSASTRNSQSVLTLGTSSGYDSAGTGANPYYRMLCERGW